MRRSEGDRQTVELDVMEMNEWSLRLGVRDRAYQRDLCQSARGGLSIVRSKPWSACLNLVWRQEGRAPVRGLVRRAGGPEG